MQQLREIRRRIASIDEIRKITKAMYTIALSRMFRLKNQLEAARAYAAAAEGALQQILRDLTEAGMAAEVGLRFTQRGPGPEAVFAVNADRGLCGRFPEEINAQAARVLAQWEGLLIAGGERARRFFARHEVRIIAEYTGFYDRPRYEHAQRIAAELLDLFLEGRIGGLSAVYMRFINELHQEAVVERLLPLAVPEVAEEGIRPLTIYEPGPEQVLEGFVQQYLAAQLYRILLESKTSEQALRRAAMKNATDNADELIKDLTLEFNKARQQAITREIADIIGGAEALRRG